MKTSSSAYRLLRLLFQLADTGWSFSRESKDTKIRGNNRRYFAYLVERGYIKKSATNKFKITELAQISLLKDIVSRRKPDGRSRIVMFDIPEKIKYKRDGLRRHLADLGFKQKQQSVWVSVLPCDDLVRKVVRYHDLSKYVALMVGNDVPI